MTMLQLPSHGVLLKLHNIGIYLIGDSGIGKSEIALQLIHQGACLICDDAPNFIVNKNPEQITGHCPKDFYGLLHIHDLGIINIMEIFSSDPPEREIFKPSQTIHFIIELVAADRLSVIKKQNPQQLLSPVHQYWQYHNQTIPGIRMHLYPGRNIPIMIKTAVMQFSALSHKTSSNHYHLSAEQ